MRKPPVAYPIPLRLLLRLGLARFPEKAESSRGHCCVEALGDGYLNRCGTGVKASSYFFSFPLFIIIIIIIFSFSSVWRRRRPAYTTKTHTTQHTQSSGGARFWICLETRRLCLRLLYQHFFLLFPLLVPNPMLSVDTSWHPVSIHLQRSRQFTAVMLCIFTQHPFFNA